MRLSGALFGTFRETPADAEVGSHQWLLRAGYVRRVASGVYAQLPLMRRVMGRVEGLIREELDALGAQEVTLPVLQPEDAWHASGRWAAYHAEGLLFTSRDRSGRTLVLGPTHEEVVTLVARDVLRSYRQLPALVYQVGAKFRDELRPRGGLLRSREFVMKDAYSFHADEASLRDAFEAMSAAYGRVLSRCGLAYRQVEADSGAIGGNRSREFMILADAGEDEVLYTPDGSYAANAERAESLAEDAVSSRFTRAEWRDTPGASTVAALCDALGVHASQVVKNMLYDAVLDSGLLVPVLVSIRGDQDVNETKLARAVASAASEFGALGVVSVQVADASRWAASDVPFGYVAPDLPDSLIARREGVASRFLRFVDVTAANMRGFVTGANAHGRHVAGVNWGAEYALPRVVDVRQARAGDRVGVAGERLESARGIEVGHVFQLGARYAEALGAHFTGRDGVRRPLLMGCYGIGVTRLAQAAAEQHHDARGLAWPVAIAPHHVIVTITNMRNAAQVDAGERLYRTLRGSGVDAMLDDRDERPGVKLRDAEMIGVPVRVAVGRDLVEGRVELALRATQEARAVRLEDAVREVQETLAYLRRQEGNAVPFA